MSHILNPSLSSKSGPSPTGTLKPSQGFWTSHHIFCILTAVVCEFLSCIQLFVTPPATACQVPLSMEFSRKEYWSGLSFPSLGDLPSPGTEPYLLHFLYWLLLSHFSRVRLCATPETAAHQAPPSLGFSRQEHWSGLPFPSPMHGSDK